MAPTSSSRPAGGEQATSGSDRSLSRTATAGAATFGADEDARSAASVKGTSSGAAGRGPRRIRLTLARLDPFSVMKLSFLVAVCFGIATVVCTALLWGVVDGIGLWDSLNDLGTQLNNNKPLPFMQLFSFSKMVSYSVVVAFVNLIIITALCTLFAFLYNIVAGLLGGLKVTFTDE